MTCHCLSTKAPLLTRLPGLVQSLPCVSSAFEWIGARLGLASSPGRNATGVSVRISRVVLSIALMPSSLKGFLPLATSLPLAKKSPNVWAYLDAVFGSSKRRMPNTKSCATTGSPFDHLAFGRNLKTHVKASDCDQSSATPGTILPRASLAVSGSNRSSTMLAAPTDSISAGSRDSGSEPLLRMIVWVECNVTPAGTTAAPGC